jgi:hypothetical protein
MAEIAREWVPPESNRELHEGGAVISLDRARATRGASNSAVRPSKPCGHDRHVGTCPACQRAQLARWRSQLAATGS